jgi:hypothetical protein
VITQSSEPSEMKEFPVFFLLFCLGDYYTQ